MDLWSIQHAKVYRHLQNTGVLHANEKFLFCGEDLKFAYDWMSEKLTQRVGKSPAGVHYPIWAWYQWEGKRSRPDRITQQGYGERGTPLVLLTLSVPDHLVLLSDFDMWHCVLNHIGTEFEQKTGDPESEEEIQKSWNNIFKWQEENPDWPEPKTVQAVFWELKKEWVIHSEFFKSN